MEAMVPTPQRNPMAPGTQQVIQSKSKKMYQSQPQQQPPPHVLLSILETTKKDGRQVETQTMEQSSEQESLQLEALSSSWSKSGKKRRGVVRLRLARFGRKKAPFYRIHVADSRAPRDGRFLERIGYYDPKPGKGGQKRIALNFERAKYWLSVGAQPSDTVRHILCIAGLLPRPLLPQMSNRLAGVRDEEDEIGLEDDEDDDGDVERSFAESELSAL